MTKRTFFLVAAMAVAASVAAQTTLRQCLEWARDNYPAVRRYGLIEQSRGYTAANAAKGWLPQVSVSAAASAFTDIADMPTQLAQTVGGIGNSLYGASVMVRQTLYDGGEIAARKRTANAQAEVERGRLDVAMYDVDGRVEELFFGILALDEQLRQNQLLQDDLRTGLLTVEGMIGGGVANESDADKVRVEIAHARQQEAGLKASREAYTRMLSAFTGHEIAPSAMLEKPSAEVPYSSIGIGNSRPELSFYAANESLLDEHRRSLNARLMPRLGAFGMGAYHNKVLGAMRRGILAAGITLSWNIGALYTRRNDIRNLEAERADIGAQRETFLFNTKLQEEDAWGRIAALKRQMEIDDEIVRLRENILRTTEKKVKGGTETANSLTRDINAVSEARQAKALHEIQLTREIYALRRLTNN